MQVSLVQQQHVQENVHARKIVSGHRQKLAKIKFQLTKENFELVKQDRQSQNSPFEPPIDLLKGNFLD